MGKYCLGSQRRQSRTLAGATLGLRPVLTIELKGFGIQAKLLPKGTGKVAAAGISHLVGDRFNGEF